MSRQPGGYGKVDDPYARLLVLPHQSQRKGLTRMKYYLVTYVQMRPENNPIEVARDESDRLMATLSYLNIILDNEEDLYRVLQHSFSGQIYWPEGSLHGYAITTKPRGDSTNG
jgi:hypothetical protein